MTPQTAGPRTGPVREPIGEPQVAARDRLIWPVLRARLDIVAAARRPESPTVLDCGGGSGRLAVPLAVAGARVVVLDISADALATLHRRADEAGVAQRVVGVQGDVEDLGVRAVAPELGEAPVFDLVLAHGVLDETEDPSAVLARMAAAVAPGGALSIVSANPAAAVLGRALSGDIAGALQDLLAESSAPPGGAEGPVLGPLIAACRAAGLQVESTQGLEVIGDLVPGAILESTPGAAAALAQFEHAASSVDPYRLIASRLHVLAGRPGPGSPGWRGDGG